MIFLLLKNIRFYILCLSFIFSFLLYLIVVTTISGERLQTIRLTQSYALTALAFLYLTLLASPFCSVFTSFPYRSQLLKSRRAFSVSTFYFGLLHAGIAFFRQLGGFEGLGYLSEKYLQAVFLGFTVLCILFILTITSTDTAIKKMTLHRWRFLHKSIYVTGVLILFHAFMLGTHFQELHRAIPQILFFALGFLFILEVLRFDTAIRKKFPLLPVASYTTIPLFAIGIAVIMYYYAPAAPKLQSFGIHTQHMQLAREAQRNTSSEVNIQYPGLKGDRTKRYTVSFNKPKNALPNQEISLEFTVYDAASGHHIQAFQLLHEKLLHLIIVNSTLDSFTHIHPELKNGIFSINTTFPDNDTYHLYLDFQPIGGIEQQIAFTLQVGTENPKKNKTVPDITFSKKIDDYQVSLDTHTNLVAEKMAVGEQQMTFTVTQANTKKPVTTLQPYLGAFGHLVMINKKTFEYLHVHPITLANASFKKTSGPTVEFLPLGLYGPIKPGIYRVFAEFNPDGNHIMADYTVTIK